MLACLHLFNVLSGFFLQNMKLGNQFNVANLIAGATLSVNT